MRFILCAVSISAVAILLATVNVSAGILILSPTFVSIFFYFNCKAGEDTNNMLRQMAEDCIEKTGATVEDVDEMVNKSLPTTKTGKCLSFCMMNQFNCVSKGNLFLKNKRIFKIFFDAKDKR